MLLVLAREAATWMEHMFGMVEMFVLRRTGSPSARGRPFLRPNLQPNHQANLNMNAAIVPLQTMGWPLPPHGQFLHDAPPTSGDPYAPSFVFSSQD